MKNYVLVMIASLIPFGNSATASPLDCQMEALSAAVKFYKADRQKFSGVGRIGNVTFESLGVGALAVVFHGQCDARVLLGYQLSPQPGGCPNYTFRGVDSTCR